MPFETMRFRHPWRAYQQRVLNTIHTHLNDQRLHLVAAPGAGKTTLGLEIFRLLGKPALVLSPTRVIRDQWLERLIDFCDVNDVIALDWASNSIHDPKVLTSATYQALHSQIKKHHKRPKEKDFEDEIDTIKELKDDEINDIVAVLKQNQIGVLILDEAHHLKAEWWKSLEKIVSRVPDLTLVSLTATPPYDVSGREWRRYKQLCGPIDDEISIPELVKAKTLCPHQDYVWASNATEGEISKILAYDQNVSTLCQTLLQSSEFVEIVSAHPWQHTKEIEHELVKNPEVAVAILLFNKAASRPNSPNLLTLLDLNEDELPDIDRRWWQVLIEAVIFSRTFIHAPQHQLFVDQLKKQLRHANLLHRNVLSIERSSTIERSLSLSTSKIESCTRIHKLELNQRGENLRQVILTDFIRDEGLISGIDTGDLDLGAWPIFERLIRSSPIPDQIGLVTGRLAIVSKAKSAQLLNQIESDQVSLGKLTNCPGYLVVSAPTGQLIKAYTHLLQSGEVKTLVSTRSLLGEGWDAPVVNSLILASTVGSFVLTNQMRGRAIRTDRTNPNKVSSIWHLVAVNNRSPSGRSDYQNLVRRFETFVGLSEVESTIESGFGRLGATELEKSVPLVGHSYLQNNNDQMGQRFKNIITLAQRWQQALIIDDAARIKPSIQINQPPSISRFVFRQRRGHLASQLGLALGTLSSGIVALTNIGGFGPMALYTTIGLGVPLLFRLRKTIPFIKNIAYHLPATGTLHQMGAALAEALSHEGHVKSPYQGLSVNVTQSFDGSCSIALSGCSYQESSIFADCMAEILGPIDNPRYLIVRKEQRLKQEIEVYHAIPTLLGVNKGAAITFFEAWQKHVCQSELIFTRSAEGRSKMIKAQTFAFREPATQKIKKQERWE